jgi:hypothetical protein
VAGHIAGVTIWVSTTSVFTIAGLTGSTHWPRTGQPRKSGAMQLPATGFGDSDRYDFESRPPPLTSPTAAHGTAVQVPGGSMRWRNCAAVSPAGPPVAGPVLVATPCRPIVPTADAGEPATIGSSGSVVVCVLNSHASRIRPRSARRSAGRSSARNLIAPACAFHRRSMPSSCARSASLDGSSGVRSEMMRPSCTVTGFSAERTMRHVPEAWNVPPFVDRMPSRSPTT